MEESIIPRDIVLFGSEQYVASRREIRAGPLSAVLQDGVIRYVKFGETEIVRRVYMALRDQNWNTIPTTYSNWNHKIGADSFRISFTGENKIEDINYKWDGSIVGESTGQISYSMNGVVQSGFKKRIIGLCALFPIRECAGRPAMVARGNKDKLSATFPYKISSQQPLPGLGDISEISYDIEGASVKVRFDGDQFEMEDQRSFTDNSYKVYSTWSRAIEPDVVIRGDKFFQSISISIAGLERQSHSERGSEESTLIEVDPIDSFPIPRIGLGRSSIEGSFNQNEIELLKALGPAYLRADFNLNSDEWRAQFQIACDQAKQLNTGLELALFVNPKTSRDELQLFKNELEKLLPQVASIIAFGRGEFVSSPELVEKCEHLFGSYFSQPKIGGGTDRNYFDLDFAHPRFEPQTLVSYSVNPQVHAFDVSSLAETLEGQAWTLSTAHKIYGNSPIAVSPITLRPRFNPDEIEPEQYSADQLPPQVDPRQMSLFGASWTAGSIKSLSESNAYSLTFYETVGWRGVLESEKGSPLPDKFHSKPGMVFPLYHVLADVAEMSGGRIRNAKSSRPLAINALCMMRGQLSRLLVYNLTWQSQEVSIRGFTGSNFKLTRLNEKTVEKAMFNARDFRSESSKLELRESRTLHFDLLPYEVIRLDYLDNE